MIKNNPLIKSFYLLAIILMALTVSCSKHPINRDIPQKTIYSQDTRKDIAPSIIAAEKLTFEGERLLRLGNLEKAIDNLEQAYSIDAANPLTALYLSHAWVAKNDFEQALQFAKRARWLYSGQPGQIRKAMQQEAVCLKKLGRVSEANDIINKIQALESESAP